MKPNKIWCIFVMLVLAFGATVAFSSCGEDDDDEEKEMIDPNSGSGNGGSSSHSVSIVGNTYKCYYEGCIDSDREYYYELTITFKNNKECVITKDGHYSQYVAFQGKRSFWEDISITEKYSFDGKVITVAGSCPKTFYSEGFDRYSWTLTLYGTGKEYDYGALLVDEDGDDWFKK